MNDLALGLLVFAIGLVMHGGFWWKLSRMREGEVTNRRGELIRRDRRPVDYWLYVALYVFGAFVGLFMMLWGGIGIGVGLGILE